MNQEELSYELLTYTLRVIAKEASKINHDDSWVEKYGTKFENEVFMMHPFCWCEDENNCLWCRSCDDCHNINVYNIYWREKCETCDRVDKKPSAPNFWYKSKNLKIWWYKYIGRDYEFNKEFTNDDLLMILKHCLESLSIVPEAKIKQYLKEGKKLINILYTDFPFGLVLVCDNGNRYRIIDSRQFGETEYDVTLINEETGKIVNHYVSYYLIECIEDKIPIIDENNKSTEVVQIEIITPRIS